MSNSVQSPLTCGFLKATLNIMSFSQNCKLFPSEKAKYLRNSYAVLMKMITDSQNTDFSYDTFKKATKSLKENIAIVKSKFTVCYSIP